MQTAAEIYNTALHHDPLKESGCNQEMARFFRDLIATPVVQKQIREARWAGTTEAHVLLGHQSFCRPCLWPSEMESHSQIKPLLDRLRKAGCFDDYVDNSPQFNPVLPSVVQEQGLESLTYNFYDDSTGYLNFRDHCVSFKFKKPQ